MKFLNPSETQRRAIYSLIAAVFAVLTAYGVLTAESAQHLLDALVDLAPVLVALMARANTGSGNSGGKHAA